MRILDFEVPNFKFPKIKMKGIDIDNERNNWN